MSIQKENMQEVWDFINRWANYNKYKTEDDGIHRNSFGNGYMQACRDVADKFEKLIYKPRDTPEKFTLEEWKELIIEILTPKDIIEKLFVYSNKTISKKISEKLNQDIDSSRIFYAIRYLEAEGKIKKIMGNKEERGNRKQLWSLTQRAETPTKKI